MNSLLIVSLIIWFAAVVFTAWQIYIAPEGVEDANGFYVVRPKVSRFRHVQIHHPLRSNRERRFIAAEH